MISTCWGGVDYPVTQPFLPGPPVIHCGVDIGCPAGTIIRAARAGIVETVLPGIVGIHVNDSNQRDFYLHGYSLVLVGQKVAAGTPVINSDTVQVSPAYPLTGPHLHFEVQDGYTLPGAPPAAPEHPLDPVPILLGGNDMNLDDYINPPGNGQPGLTVRQFFQFVFAELIAGKEQNPPNDILAVIKNQPINTGGLTSAQAAQLADVQSTLNRIEAALKGA